MCATVLLLIYQGVYFLLLPTRFKVLHGLGKGASIDYPMAYGENQFCMTDLSLLIKV